MFEFDNNIHWLMVLIPALPLAAALLTGALGGRLRDKSYLPALVATLGSFVLSLCLATAVYLDLPADGHGPGVRETIATEAKPDGESARPQFPVVVQLWTWARVDDALRQADGPFTDSRVNHASLDVGVALRADSLTAIMLVMVTLISSLVVIYSTSYMHGDPGQPRYFAFVSLFVFSMTMLVSASNFLLLYVFWEGVGVCSYFLIGFWFHKPSASAAGKKAFLVNRVGDVGLALGIFTIWTVFGTLNFHDVNYVPNDSPTPAAAADVLAVPVEGIESGQLVRGVLGPDRLTGEQPYRKATSDFVFMMICFLLLLGACGKSAQFPLHVWLPDAMEG
ncbi:MAG: proton-conducting transporter membrane subunit, partial [Planctomycetales bacterium]